MFARQLSSTRLCVKVVVKLDFADRRDPKRVWRTLAYRFADLHAGLKGSIMETLSENYSRIASIEDQFRDVIVKAMRDQQFLSVVVVLDGLDEFLTDDDEHWRALLDTVASWANLPGGLSS